MKNSLKPEEITNTIAQLQARISERFSDSGLSNVCNQFLSLTLESQQRIDWIDKPNLWIRVGIGVFIVVTSFTLFFSFEEIDFQFKVPNLTELIQVTEALINEIVLISAALFFLFSIETRIKRHRSLLVLHDLRSLAHVVDMHQLTKDPSALTGTDITKSSPKRDLSPFLLKRYLDYCSEILSLIGKVAALYSQRLPDAEIVSAANDIEQLCTGLSQKIWQKLIMLEDARS